jgi:hypothetical protein
MKVLLVDAMVCFGHKVDIGSCSATPFVDTALNLVAMLGPVWQQK